MRLPPVVLPLRFSFYSVLLVVLASWQMGVAAEETSVVDRTSPLETVRTEFELADGAASVGSQVYVPDVKAKKLYAFASNKSEGAWRVVQQAEGAFSGTHYQLGKLFLADNGNASIVTWVSGKKPQVLVQFEDGARPNDLTVDHVGNVYVTCTREGQIRRVAPNGDVTVAARGIERPNGIALSPDGKKLYVSSVSTGKLFVAEVVPEGLGAAEVFAQIQVEGDAPKADGMTVDRAGNVYCAAADAVWIFDPTGRYLDRIVTPERPINCCFGGQHARDLYISTFGCLLRQQMNAYGVQSNPAMEGAPSQATGKPPTTIPAGIDTTLNHAYYQDGARRLLCDIIAPSTSSRDEAEAVPLPAIVLVHGGGWLHGDKTKFRSLAIKLAKRGFVVMSVEYRLGYESKFPAGVHDCNAALLYLRSHCEQWNVDPDRIFAVGGSAGGHIVGLMATGHDNGQLRPTGKILAEAGVAIATTSRPSAAVVMAGPMQIASGSVAERSGPGKTSNATHWIGNTIDQARESYSLADAFEKISSDDPPLLFMTGSKDNPTRDLPSLKRLQQEGVPTRQVIHQGATHGHWNRSEWIDTVVDDIVSFLTEH